MSRFEIGEDKAAGSVLRATLATLRGTGSAGGSTTSAHSASPIRKQLRPRCVHQKHGSPKLAPHEFGEKGTSGGGEGPCPGVAVALPGLSVGQQWPRAPCLPHPETGAAFSQGAVPETLRGCTRVPVQRQGLPAGWSPLGWSGGILALGQPQSTLLPSLPRSPAPTLAAESPSLTTAPFTRR